METKTQRIDVVILERDRVRFGSRLDSETAMTLVAVASEDPACWEDLVAFWPRYRTPTVPEFADNLAMKLVEHDTALGALRRHDSWIVIDLVRKRIATGRDVQPIGRDEVFAMVVDESGAQHCPLSIHLPPWWELREQTDRNAIDNARESPLVIPHVNRNVLFGRPMTADLARRLLDIIDADDWKSSGADEDEHARYAFTVRVHRDWLMTPRQDLGGLMPRQMLHGAHDWIDRLVWAQQLRFQDVGEIVAVPDGISEDNHAPMGSEEMVIYFDLCRELIGAGWERCLKGGIGRRDFADRSRSERELNAFLSGLQQEWLASPFEGGSSPRFIIECSRRRVPRAAGVPIVGIAECEPEQHVIDGDCPICNMMAEGTLGTAFTGIDGHHLELDDEFAFSMHETREAWDEQQREFAEMSAAFDRERAGPERASGTKTEPDEFASVWSGQFSDEPIPGDPQGHLKLAFLLSEVVVTLQMAGVPSKDIRQLTERFAAFRRCDRSELPARGKQLGEQLENVAGRYPELVSRVADLQSRIDEHVRAPGIDDELSI